MPTQLIRDALRSHYAAAKDAHPGLLVQRGYPSDEDSTAKTGHIQRICAIPPSAFYHNAYQRWRQATADPLRFKQLELSLQPHTRLFVGLSVGGMLETGCAISHSYGMPYIPGSSIKGVVRAHVRQSPFADQHPEVVDEIFGAAADATDAEDEGVGYSGVVAFHDAWWVPTNKEISNPFVEEVVTSHHLNYYGKDGAVAPSDCDSPIPNAQIATQGSFLFVLQGEQTWRELAAQMLLAALSVHGIGAKTRSGYGVFDPKPAIPASPACPWVDETIERLCQKDNSKPEVVLRGKGLAEAWQNITDESLKAEALADIRSRWEREGWWDQPPGKSAKKAKAIYEGGAAGE
ncbi:type III-B CRISPR module RAMP protein Cmr6 [Halorhodospira halochloris]|uniref:type III-B CRISPR module RAMP protein Cmr6 n=1 Tax=Halorhodospira halochloris TaxID=1052 RepID=UPI001EE92205|nr:type III-B CRISPR module RAMP protein Cmr6 [Halorhodospira halochloris]MCG5531156.1 type III-B CRISPR module RAMP protein Cmr6 [Halorhodospira halochloris]